MESDRSLSNSNPTGNPARFSSAADLLRTGKETILGIWEERARARLPGARMETHLALRDSLPDFLDDLEEALRTSVRQVRADLVRVAKKHGAERARSSDYTIEEALAEYNILRKVIFEVLERQGQLSARERDVIYEAINFGITKAGTEYAKLQTEKENLAKLEAERGRALLEAVIAQMPAAVWLADSQGKVTGNSLSHTTLRQPPTPASKVAEYGEYIGYHPDGSRYLAEEWPLARALLKKETIAGELVRVERLDGTEAYVRLYAAPVESGGEQSAVAIGVDETKSMQTQQRLAESQAQLRLALAASKVGIFDYDIKSGIVEWTREEALMFGFPHDRLQIHYSEVNERIHPEDRTRMQEAIQQAVARHGEYQSEFRVILPDQSVRWLRGVGQVVLGPDAQPIKVRGANLDQTEIKMAQNARDRAYERLNVITDSQPTLISYVDPQYRYQFVNRTYEEWFGKSRADVVGKTLVEVIGEEVFAQLKPHLDRALAGERVQFEQLNEFEKVGTKFVHGTYVPDVASDGTIRGVFGSIADVTELKKTSEQIRQSEEKYRTVTEFSPLVKFTTDREGHDTFVNRAWMDYLGVKQLEPGRAQWVEAIHPEDRERTVQGWNSAMKSGLPYENEYRLRRASDGEYRWFRVKARPVFDSHQQIQQWIGVAVDIDDQVRSQERHKELIASLQLEKSLREQFVNTLTHDLRTPLAAIKMAAQISNRKAQDATVQSMTARILENVERSDRMIQDLLDANRIKAGQGIIPEIQSIDLTEVIRCALEDLTTVHGDRFRLEAPDTLSAYLCPKGMRRMVENLCTNAVKYGKPNRPITVRLEPADSQFRIRVHNWGDPLPESEKKRLFATFHRTQSAVESGAMGWGIGLTIVKGVAEAHCGEVDVRSEAETGTEFIVTVPQDARGSYERGCGQMEIPSPKM